MTEPEIQTILVPVDFSAGSRAAVEYAAALADKLGAEIHLLHVGVKPVDYWPLDRWLWGSERAEHSLDDDVRAASKRALNEFVAELPAELRDSISDTRLEVGVPYDVITEVAADYDLVVMAASGRTGGKRVLLGSVAERVLRQAPCPVLTVRPTS